MKSIRVAIICVVLVLLIGNCSEEPVSNSASVEQAVTSSLISALPMTSILPYGQNLGQKVVIIKKSWLRFAYIRIYFNSQHFNVPLMLRWARWIWPPPRTRRPYRNPLRAFRLNKKQRKRLRRRLSILLTTKQECFFPTAAQLSSSTESA